MQSFSKEVVDTIYKNKYLKLIFHLLLISFQNKNQMKMVMIVNTPVYDVYEGYHNEIVENSISHEKYMQIFFDAAKKIEGQISTSTCSEIYRELDEQNAYNPDSEGDISTGLHEEAPLDCCHMNASESCQEGSIP
jgi:hypothetical protein